MSSLTSARRCTNFVVSFYYIIPQYKSVHKRDMLRVGKRGTNYFDSDELKQLFGVSYGWVGNGRGVRGQSAKGGGAVQLIKDDARVETAKNTKKQGSKATVAAVGKLMKQGKKATVAAVGKSILGPTKSRKRASQDASPTSRSEADTSDLTLSQIIRTVIPWKDVEQFLLDRGWSYTKGNVLSAFF